MIKKIVWTVLAVAVVGVFSISYAAEETSTTNTSRDTRNLEKIAHPAYIKDFEAIQRIGNALWGKRKTESGNSASRISEGRPESAKSVRSDQSQNRVKVEESAKDCVKTAIEAKDSNLKDGLTAYNTSMLAAIDARTSCQTAALDLSSVSEQQQASQTCIRTYHQTVGQALKTLKMTKETGWRTYRDALKTCFTLQRTANTSDKGEILIEDGEMQINLEVATDDMTENQ